MVAGESTNRVGAAADVDPAEAAPSLRTLLVPLVEEARSEEVVPVDEDSEGRWTTKIVSTVFTNHQDIYAKDCRM